MQPDLDHSSYFRHTSDTDVYLVFPFYDEIKHGEKSFHDNLLTTKLVHFCPEAYLDRVKHFLG